jgi:hypothetical protein
MRISQDKEGSIENGGFRFRETVMTRNSLDEIGELRKVLRLRWDTVKDKISLNIQINYGEKKKGAYVEDSMDVVRG